MTKRTLVRILALIMLVIVVLAITWATRDICWTGSGYGSCIKMIEDQLK